MPRRKTMSTGLDVFDTTIQKTNIWLKDLMWQLGWEDRHQAYEGLRVTLQTLRDRLTVEEAAQFGAQLPLLLRGAYYEGWVPGHPSKERHLEAFLAPIQAHFRHDPRVDGEEVARAVFRVLANHISAGEIEDIRHALPKTLNTLWPTDVRPA
jgi:uncharacterized protein (DUF2267 family)